MLIWKGYRVIKCAFLTHTNCHLTTSRANPHLSREGFIKFSFSVLKAGHDGDMSPWAVTVTVKSWFFVTVTATVTGGEKNIHRHRHRREKKISPSPSPPNKKIFTVTVTAGRYFFHRNRQIYFLPSRLQWEILYRIYQPKHHTLSQRSQYRVY